MSYYLTPYLPPQEEVNSWVTWLLGPADPRVDKWLLMTSCRPTLQLMLSYLLLVAVGPLVMANFKPFKLNWLLIPYNLSMAVLNLYITVTLFAGFYINGYNILCQQVVMSTSYWEMMVVGSIWWYYISKLCEFMDTVFFILRKKNNQISFLHVYHHVSMFGLFYLGAKYVPGGTPVLFCGVNALVHVPMYSYYGLAAASTYYPNIRKHLWWKKYLTVMQITQFCGLMLYGAQGTVNNCGFPMWMVYTMFGYLSSMLILFLNFYNKTYDDKSKKLETGTETKMVDGKKTPNEVLCDVNANVKTSKKEK